MLQTAERRKSIIGIRHTTSKNRLLGRWALSRLLHPILCQIRKDCRNLDIEPFVAHSLCEEHVKKGYRFHRMII